MLQFQHDWKWQIIWDNLDLETVQQYGHSKEEVFNQIHKDWLEGFVTIYGSKKYKTVSVVREESPFVIDVHIYANTSNQWDIVKGYRNLIAWVWRNTPYIKLEMRTHLPKVCALARRLGFKHEGTRENSFVTKDGKIINEFEYGMSRPEEHTYE